MAHLHRVLRSPNTLGVKNRPRRIHSVLQNEKTCPPNTLGALPNTLDYNRAYLAESHFSGILACTQWRMSSII